MKNHYIQKKFIEYFCGNNGILIYDILNNKILHKHTSANNIAVSNDLYHFDFIYYPDEQIEKDLKFVEDNGLDIVIKIAKSETLPNDVDLAKLISYFFYQSKRIPFNNEAKQEEIRKLNKICKTSVFNDLPIFELYCEKTNIKSIKSILKNYTIYLLKHNEPIFFITDCFCGVLQNNLEQVIPITRYLALYLVPKYSKQIVPLSLKNGVANLISDNEYLTLLPFFALSYKQFAFASYTEKNCNLLPNIFKLIKKYN